MILVAVIVASLLTWYAWRRIFWVSPQPRMLRTAQHGSGTLDVVVVDDDRGEPSERPRPALLQCEADVGRRVIVRVLPEGSSRRDAEEAGRQLCRYADAVGRPAAGVAVLFGASDAAVTRFAIGEGYDVVLHLGNDRHAKPARPAGGAAPVTAIDRQTR